MAPSKKCAHDQPASGSGFMVMVPPVSILAATAAPPMVDNTSHDDSGSHGHSLTRSQHESHCLHFSSPAHLDPMLVVKHMMQN